MAEAKAGATGLRNRPSKAPRPLSPHFQIFRPYINMVMSIMHRITGVANYAGSLLLAIWLLSAAAGKDQFDYVSGLLGTLPGKIVLFGFTWSVMHHMLGGMRHIIWDSGKGFDIPTVRLLSWATIIGSLILTGAIWIAALASKGGF